MGVHERPWRDETDLPAMRALVSDARRAAPASETRWHVGDLTWRFHLLSYRADPRARIRLWQDGDRLVGFAVHGDDGSFDWQLHPEFAWQGIEGEMLAWADASARQTGDDRDLPCGSLETDGRRIAFLEAAGYRRAGESMVHLTRSLERQAEPPRPPSGFAVRALAGDGEVPSRAEAHRQAFHPSRVTDEGYRALMRLPGYERALDVVVASPGGDVAAFALVWLDEANRIGEFEPVGTRPGFRRMGLARAALLEGLRRMRDRGADRAIVYAEPAGPAAGLYAAVGFEPGNVEWEYRRGG